MTDTNHFTPADLLPCLTCGCDPIAWRAKGLWHLACVQIHPQIDVVNPGPDLGVLVREWNRLNSANEVNSDGR